MKLSRYGSISSSASSGPTMSNDLENTVSQVQSQKASSNEKKCLLINYEIDSLGMGRYQWCIWLLCGFGYLLDLMWAQAFGLVLSPLQQEFGFRGDQSGQISTSFSAGLTAGAAFFGIIVDVIGRKWAFNLSTLISSIFGLCLGAANDYSTFLVLTAFVGFGIGGNIPIDTTITLEFIPQDKRRLLSLLSVFQPIGVVVTTAIAYGFIPSNSCKPDWTQEHALTSCNLVSNVAPPKCCGKSNNMGWRYTLFTIGAITLACFFLRFVVFTFRESPKFLIYRGKDEKAIQVLQEIAKFNKRTCSLTYEMLKSVDDDQNLISSKASASDSTGQKSSILTVWHRNISHELQRFKLFYSSVSMASLTLLVWLTYFCDYWGFTLAATFLPTIVSLKNAAIDVGVQESYRQYVYIYLPGILGVLLGALLYDVPRIGRKWTMVFSSGLMGASLFLFAKVNSAASNIGLNAMEYFFQSMFNAVLYGWTPEVFPAPIRGTASGIASFWGRLASIVAPVAGQSLLPADPDVNSYTQLLYLAGGITFGCVIFTALLPSKLVGKQSL